MRGFLVGLLLVAGVGWLALGGCGGSSGGAAGGTATLTGLAVDAGTRAGLPGAVASAQGHSATANNSGFFTLTGLASGNLTLSLAASGHQTTTLPVSLPAGGLALGTVALLPAHVAGDGDVSGQVTLGGAGASGARVVTTTAQATADSFGSFTLYNLPAGVVLINALSADGSAVGSATVIVPANGRLSGVGILLSSGPPPPP